MAVTVRGVLPPLPIEQVPPAQIFAIPHGAGWMYAVNGEAEGERLVIYLGARGTEHDAAGAGFDRLADHQGTLVQLLPNAAIEVLSGSAPWPIPEEEPANGSLLVDEVGQSWLQVRLQNGAMSFSLEDGRAGRPAGTRRARYSAWRLVWSPETAPAGAEPVELLRSPPEAR